MRAITPEDVLEAGDVLHHAAFGFATVETVDGTLTLLAWERPGSAHPGRVGRTNLEASYRRCDRRGFLARTVRDADLARALFSREPLDALALLLLDLGRTNRGELRDWLVERRLLAETRFDGWWNGLLPQLERDGRFAVQGAEVEVKPDVTYETLLVLLETPLPGPGTLGVSGLWDFARRVARALAEVHAAGETLVRDRGSVRLGADGVRLGAVPGGGPDARRADVRFVARLVLEQLLGPLPSPADLPDADLACLVLGLAPTVPPEFLAAAQLALAQDPELRPFDGLALLERLTMGEAAATLRASAPHLPSAEVSVGFNSHIGTLKSLQGQTNQDSFLVAGEPSLALVAVADGISLSSAGSGDMAAAMATRTLRAFFADQLQALSTAPPGRAQALLTEGLRRANKLICETAFRLADGDIEHNIPMGTTLIAALCQGNRLTLASLGDSRAYLLGAFGVGQLVPDQNLQALRLREALSGHEVEWDEPRYSLTGYLGHFTMDGKAELPAVFTRSFTLLPGEWVVLCSDGLSDYAATEDAAVLGILEDAVRAARGSTAGARAMEVARRLVDAANRGGGGDNVTVLALTLSPDYGAPSADPSVAS